MRSQLCNRPPVISRSTLAAISTALLLIVLISIPPFCFAQTDSPVSPRLELSKTRPEVIRYSRIQYGLYFLGWGWEFLGLGLAIRFGVGPMLRKRAEWAVRASTPRVTKRSRRIGRIRLYRLLRSRFVRAALVFTGFSALMLVWRIPFQLTGYQLDRAYEFATLGPGLWFWDRLLGYVIGLIRIPLVWLGYLLIERYPTKWWLFLWAVLIPCTFALTVLNPVLFDRAYNDFHRLQNPNLERRLLDLSRKAGIPNATVLIADYSKRTTKVNAYVTGIGPSARMVLWDTTLTAMSEDEIVAIMGHEIGHYVLKHIWWSFVAGVGASFVILWILSIIYSSAVKRWGARAGIRSLHDIAALPIALALLSALMFLQTPIESAFSRKHEREADRYGLELTRMPEATASGFIRFVERNYTEPDPPAFIVFWFYSHPPLRERVESALRFTAREAPP